MQTKNLPINCLELKFAGENMRFSGYASVFNGVDSYGDTIIQGAYSKTLAQREREVKMRWNHYGPVIGKWLRMVENEKGLYVEGELTPGHSKAIDVYASLKHGAIDGLSIGYYPVQIEQKDDGTRLLKEINLIEISVVEEPADINARIGDIKSAINAALSLKEIEALLRDAGGFSRGDATALVSRIKTLALGDRDAELRQKQELAALFGIKI